MVLSDSKFSLCLSQDVRKASELETAMEKQKLKIDIAETGQIWGTKVQNKEMSTWVENMNAYCECELDCFLIVITSIKLTITELVQSSKALLASKVWKSTDMLFT